METTTIPSGTIVVGVDGSSSAARALEWATDQAVHEHRPLTLVHGVGPSGVVWIDQHGPDHRVAVEAMREEARIVLDDALAAVLHRAPGLEVHQVLRVADGRQALLDESKDAAMMVVGSRGRGPVKSLLLGSVGVAVTRHAACPVVVVRPHNPGLVRQGVLVGVDGSAPAPEMLEFAYRMASQRGLPLTVMHCFWVAHPISSGDEAVGDEAVGGEVDDLEEQRLLVAESVSGMAEKFPDVPVRTEIERGLADEALVRAGAHMDLVVVGAHHGSTMSEIVYGSVAASVVEHASCPVAVVPEPGRR